MIMILGNSMLLKFDIFYREGAPFDDTFEGVCADDVYDGDGDDADHLLVEVDGPEPSGCGNDAE